MKRMETPTSTIEPGARAALVAKTVLALVLLLAIAAGGLFFYRSYGRGQLTPADRQALEKASMEDEDAFSPSAYKDYLATVDRYVQSDDVSERVKNELLFQKALMMLDSKERQESVREELRNEGLTILKGLYALPGTDDDTRMIKAKAIAQYLLYFNQLFFMPSNSRYLPDAYSAPYLAIAGTEPVTTFAQLSRNVQAAFEAHAALSMDAYAEPLGNDRTFVSNRIYLLASYLDAYASRMDSSERKRVLRQLHEDLIAYPKTVKLLFTDPRHTALAADFYYAYGYDVYTRTFDTGKEFDASLARELYEKARANVDTSGDYAETNAVMGQYIDAYFINYLVRIPTTETEKIAELTAELAGFAKDKDAAEIMGYFYRALMQRGADSPLRSSLTLVASKSDAFAAYVKSVGAALK
jgi:hypothetical protein